MVEVEKSGLIANQTFKSKDLLQLHISEEANLHDINTIAIQNDHTNLTVIGVNTRNCDELPESSQGALRQHYKSFQKVLSFKRTIPVQNLPELVWICLSM